MIISLLLLGLVGVAMDHPAMAAENESAASTSMESTVAANRSADMQDAIEKWNRLTPDEQQVLRERYRSFQALSAEEKEQLRRRLQRFREMTPEEQAEVKRAFARWQRLSTAEKQRMRDLFERFQALPEEQRREIRREMRDQRPNLPGRREMRPHEAPQRPSTDLPGRPAMGYRR
ncbi:MAG: DUF3106 domain-containing protein [Desulfuromonadales bacterium]|nr:DUF3106 domain-containing protein [Desulfuromonadales bacterium]NIS44039.1 DUF3106 domain-containing protein [Desulfuromonadales bacterium]